MAAVLPDGGKSGAQELCKNVLFYNHMATVHGVVLRDFGLRLVGPGKELFPRSGVVLP
jgi:S-ribosylhomocysteine lyase LuxS involved in autoinducer biosynthesis